MRVWGRTELSPPDNYFKHWHLFNILRPEHNVQRTYKIKTQERGKLRLKHHDTESIESNLEIDGADGAVEGNLGEDETVTTDTTTTSHN